MIKEIIITHSGEFAALLTAFLWAFTVISFEYAAKIVGSLAVNIIRLAEAFLLLTLFSWIYRGIPFPVDASMHAWIWLFISGITGFSIGDLFLMKAFVIIGGRVSMLIYSAVPVITALLSWIFLNEVLSVHHISGMIITISGIIMVILTRQKGQFNIKFNYPLSGILFALCGTLGQSVGLVLSKYGMGTYSAFSATQIRILAGLIGFIILFFPLKAWPKVNQAVRNRIAMRYTAIGAVFGPFLGVSFSLIAIKNTAIGIASTIMSIVPIIIIPLSVIIFKEKVKFKEIIGAVIAVCGVYIMFL